jgi:hypothetical protein
MLENVNETTKLLILFAWIVSVSAVFGILNLRRYLQQKKRNNDHADKQNEN